MSDRKEPAEDPAHIAVEYRSALTKGDTGNRPCGIVSDPWKGPDPLIGIRKLSAIFFDDKLGRLVEVSCPRIIAEPLPDLQDLIEIRCCKGFDRREPFEPTLIIRNDRIHLGLLEHDLRDPDFIGIFRPPPGEVTLRFGVPGEEFFLEKGLIHEARIA